MVKKQSASNTLEITSPKIIKLLYQLMYDVDKLFNYHNIPYWIIAGTSLGAIRHGGIIPWDDDVDIGIDKRDGKSVWELKGELKKCGYDICRHWLGYKIFYKNIKPKGRYKYSFPNLDVFFMEHHKGKIRYSRKVCREMWPKEYWYEEEIFPLKRYTFGDYDVWGCNNHKNYLERTFGKKWFSQAYREYDHETEQVVDKVLVKLTDKDRIPAEPTKINKKNCIIK